MNGHATKRKSRTEIEIEMLNKQLQQSQNYAKFHGDPLLGVSQLADENSSTDWL